ncbi:hypothetical protein DPEC_G00147130 [Dallia pectoralis]|uniref:Uncharacterized protein n=1 Tax=Dallia pectoralis TaxID=75939 RepID=A0ACC2GIP0_DALPE|nr:hypothetical protein DPEC_G00147130 [Dallia pectoralis]
MRVAVGIHKNDIDAAIETHNLGCRRSGSLYASHRQRRDDSIEGIYDTLKQCALISKSAGHWSGGQLHRATGSYIAGTNGNSNGLVPMLRGNNTARYVDQGGNKKNTGKEEQRARDLFYAMWIPDLFMKRVENNEDWSLMCPSDCPGLDECWGRSLRSFIHGKCGSALNALLRL